MNQYYGVLPSLLNRCLNESYLNSLSNEELASLSCNLKCLIEEFAQIQETVGVLLHSQNYLDPCNRVEAHSMLSLASMMGIEFAPSLNVFSDVMTQIEYVQSTRPTETLKNA